MVQNRCGSAEQNTQGFPFHVAVVLFSESERESGAAMAARPYDQAGGAGKSEGVAAAWEEITSDSELDSVDTLSRLRAIIDTQDKYVSPTRSSSS